MSRKQELMHKAVPYFESAPCYELEDLRKLQGLHRELAELADGENMEQKLDEYEAVLNSLHPRSDAPEKILLWKEGNMPSFGTYTENPDLRYNHDPDFVPYMIPVLTDKAITPKGALVVCAGGDHGDCTMHEGYQTCVDFAKLGYQCFLLLNRVNHNPWDIKEAAADAARAVQLVREKADLYRVEPNRVAFAGFSNGALTCEGIIEHFTGTQKIGNHFPDFVPDATDAYYAGPDAFLCIYGPRFADAKFDYTNAVYPPTFIALGRDDFAMPNFEATYPDLLAHHVEVEVHTFSGVPHGQSGLPVYGINPYPHFQLWVPLADAFMQNAFAKSVVKHTPDRLDNPDYRYDAFANGKPLLGKKKNHLPAMGWNSWNAFGSGNSEKLTKAMADCMVELGLDKLGYRYLVLDDGCYKNVRENGKLANETVKFPSGFRALGDYIHDKGLKFGMYNDIGTNLCAGAAVGTCGHEKTDAQSYVDWGVDFLKVDNCYYLFDNATFSDRANAKYVFAPNIKGMILKNKKLKLDLIPSISGKLVGEGIRFEEDYVTGIGTFDGTGPDASPVGARSGELWFEVTATNAGEYTLIPEYATAMEEGQGSWLQIAIGEGEEAELVYDDFVPASPDPKTFVMEKEIRVQLKAGKNVIRLMNHRRQENTLSAYAALLAGLQEAAPDNDILFSICEWGKTQPQNWGYKVGDSWRILNDITFRVGADGNPGHGAWVEGYTTSVTTQYSKAVIMDEFAGLDKGWNDPDMMMIGMDGLNETMNKSHMTMWCMLNAPLMLGLDLRRVQKGDALYKIISNKALIDLNQDALGIQAKRIFSTLAQEEPDKEYIRDINRVDILAKPLADGSVALSFLNISEEDKQGRFAVDRNRIDSMLGTKLVNREAFLQADGYHITDLWSGETCENTDGVFAVDELKAWDNVTVKVTPWNK